jgi:hypothetical protein
MVEARENNERREVDPAKLEYEKGKTFLSPMKRAELGLLEVLGLVVNAAGGNVSWGAKDSSLFYFWRNNRDVFYFRSGR